MKGKEGKKLAARTKAVIAMRRLVGWTRSEWINEVESALGEAFIVFCQARLARKNRQRRQERAWTAEFDRLLYTRILRIFVHPLKRAFDPKAAFEEAVKEMAPETIPATQEYVERQFEKAVAKIRRGLDDDDVREFWKTARWAARILIGVD